MPNSSSFSMISLDNNHNNNNGNNGNGRAVFNPTTTSPASSTIDLVAPSDNISIATNNDQIMRDDRGANGNTFRGFQPMKNFRSIKTWGRTIQLRLPLFVVVILGLSMLFLLAFFLHSVFFQNADSNSESGTLVFGGGDSNSTELGRLVSEARDNFHEYFVEISQEQEIAAQYLMNLVSYFEYCLELKTTMEELKSETSMKNETGQTEVLLATTKTAVENSDGINGTSSVGFTTSTTTSTTEMPSPDQKWEEDRRKKMRPACEKVLKWLRQNPWHSVSEIRRRRVEFRDYYEHLLKRIGLGR